MTDEAMIQGSLDAINSLLELLVKYQAVYHATASGRQLVTFDQLHNFQLSLKQLLDNVHYPLSRLRVLPYFRVSLKFYSKVLAIEKPECPLLNEQSKCF